MAKQYPLIMLNGPTVADPTNALITPVAGAGSAALLVDATMLRNGNEPYHEELQYLALLQELVNKGTVREDRTGTGTISVFGRSMRFDLSRGFPLLTTKKLWWKGIVGELLWMLSGSTNANDLDPSIQKWWTPWARGDGFLGPIYGEQYRKARWWFEVEPKIFEPPVIERKEGLFCGVGNIGPSAAERGQSEELKLLKDAWRGMLKRCYDTSCKSYTSYGGVGVHVDPKWFEFDTFKKEATKLPGWALKLAYPDEYSLDKDIRHASNRYAFETCMWGSKTEQSLNTSTGTPFIAQSPEGEQVLFPSIGSAVRECGLNASAVHRCLNRLLHTHHDWSSFKYVGNCLRFREVDQLKKLIADLRHNPSSRRHVLNLWNTPAMEHAELPCCHGSVLQFYVEDGKLSCQMYQRSADIFVGVPVNVASYALLTHLIAREVGLGVGEFIHTFGDLHLYANHIEQAKEQLTRTPRPFPYVTLPQASLFDVKTSEITLGDYNPHPAIKGEVSV